MTYFKIPLKLESNPGFIEQSGHPYESSLGEIDYSDRTDKSLGMGLAGLFPKRSIQPNAGVDQWESEQSGDSDKQVIQTIEREYPQSQQLQQALAISQAWSDDQLLPISAKVENYFRQPLPEPDVNRVKQLHGELERVKEQNQQLLDRVD